MWVGNRKEILKPTFERYPFVRASKSDEGVTLSLSISLRGPVQITNVVVKTKLFCNNPHHNGFSFFLSDLPPLSFQSPLLPTKGHTMLPTSLIEDV